MNDSRLFPAPASAGGLTAAVPGDRRAAAAPRFKFATVCGTFTHSRAAEAAEQSEDYWASIGASSADSVCGVLAASEFAGV